MAKRQGRLRIGDLMQRAVQMHQAGNLEDAIEIYGKVLEKVPAHPDALHLSLIHISEPTRPY